MQNHSPAALTDYSFDFSDGELHDLMDSHEQGLLKLDAEHGQLPLIIDSAEILVAEQQEGLLPPARTSEDGIDQADGKVTRQEVLEIEQIRQEINLPPLQRFRSKYKHLSVSDLVAPAWCELQFQYALEKTGKKRRTPAMKRGTKIHAALELEVHQVVPFEVSKTVKEEKLGLQLLKLYTGLLELETGDLTRELHVFGTIDGIHIKGVIDELVAKEEAPVSQERQLMDGFFAASQSTTQREISLSDAKTRVSNTAPPESQVGQAKLQLMLYRTLLRDMADFDFTDLLAREKLQGMQVFSDAFLAQSMQLLDSFSQDSLGALSELNTLDGLWLALLPKLKRVQAHLGSQLFIDYIHQKTSKRITRVAFQADDGWQADQMKQVLGWWRGEHAPRGVEIEEAFKCRLCDFEEGCSWKLGKIEELEARRREKRASAQSVVM